MAHDSHMTHFNIDKVSTFNGAATGCCSISPCPNLQRYEIIYVCFVSMFSHFPLCVLPHVYKSPLTTSPA